MARANFVGVITYLALAAGNVPGQSSLPLVEDVEPAHLQRQCVQLLEILKDSLSAEDWRALADLANRKGRLPADFGERVQKLLDPRCLIAVSINPESRVKAARGSRAAELVAGKDTLVLVRVHNEAGVTHGLQVSGDQLRDGKDAGPGRWLEARVLHAKPAAAKLSGQKLEYVVMRLKARDAGKREATLKFDVGQGTQDLGFRAEVPILFTVRAAKAR